MGFRKSKIERKLVAYYFATILAVVGAVSVVAIFTLKNFTNLSERDAILLTNNEVRQDAAAVGNFITEISGAVEAFSLVLDRMLEENAEMSQIQKFMAVESERAARHTDSLSGTVFGLIRGEFVHGDNWKPSEGYVPTRRAWYRDALLAHGKVVFGKPFVGSRNAAPALAFSKSLVDQNSVIAFTLPLIGLNKFILSRSNVYGGIWMVMDKAGLVITSSGEIRQGFNCLSSDAWGMDEEKLAREVLLAEEKPFEFNFNGKGYMVFSSLASDDWYMVRLVEKAKLFDRPRWIFVRCVLIFSVILVVLFLLCSYAFWSRVRMIRSTKTGAELLENISREFRTPLNGILSMTRIMLRDEKDGTMREYVKNVQVASAGLLSAVHDLQEIAKLESNDLVLNPSQYDVYSVLRDCFDTVSPRATAKNLHFSLECDPEIPSSLWGDEGRIRQIIVNLLSNAILYTEVGEVRLIVDYDIIPSSTGISLDERILLKITIKDSGMGVRDEIPDTFFGLFQLSDSVNVSGTRFSFNLTKQLISLCGGDILVKSRYGEGSTYMVTIPQMVLNIEPMGDFASRYRNDARDSRFGGEILFAPGARILAVDDAELNLRVIRGLLKDTRVQIDTALNGSQCLDMVRTKRYDLILLDNLMPMMDGRETYERMKHLADNLNKDTPVIILIAGPVPVDKESYLSAGFADYIPKPLMEEDLLRVLKWYLPKRLLLTREDLKETPNFEFPTRPADAIAFTSSSSTHKNDSVKSAAPAGDVELSMVTAEHGSADRIESLEEFLNVKAGLEYCANDEGFYQEMLVEYVGGSKRDELEKVFAQEDWANYQILIHSLKSTSLTIGADAFSGEAKSLEMACREGRVDFVKENHGRVMELYSVLLHKISKCLES